MVHCHEARDLFSPLLDGELTEPIKNGLQEHLVECQPCTHELESMQQATLKMRSYLSEFRLTSFERKNIRESVLGRIFQEPA